MTPPKLESGMAASVLVRHGEKLTFHSVATALRRTLFGRRPTPLILQSEAAECALAALCMVAGHHGHELELTDARQRFSASLRGCTVADLVTMGRSLGLTARPLRLEPEEMHELGCPAILHWSMNHFVVLTAVRRRGIVIHDPASGRRFVPWSETSDAFTGVAIEFQRAATFTPRRGESHLSLGSVWRAVPGAGRFAAELTALAIVVQLVALATPFFFQLIVDDALVAADSGLLLAVVTGLGFLSLFESSLTALRGWAVAVASAHLSRGLATSLTAHLLNLPLQFFERRHTGDILNRIASLEVVRSVITSSVVGIVVDGAVILLTSLAMLAYDTQLGILAIAMLTLMMAIRLLLYPRQRTLEDQSLHAQAREQTCAIESVRAMSGIRTANGEHARHRRWSHLLTQRIGAELDIARFQVGTCLLENLLQGALHLVIIWLAAKLVMTSPQDFTLGMLFAFMAWKNQFSERSATFVNHLIACRMLDVHLNRIGDIALEPAAISHARSGTLDVPGGDIKLNRIGFRHAATEAWVLHELDLHIPAGGMVAIIGSSGCGKTTLAKLLLGLYEPETGSITVGEVPLRAENTPLWRCHTGAVLQDDQLFSGTIADNIAFPETSFNLADVEQASAFAGIHEEIRCMPMGYLSLVGDLGSSLSGGQKQRLLIARALYRRPQVLILDEGSAHLDSANEAMIGELLTTLPCTRIVIAHRPAWVQRADRVLELRDGRLFDVTREWQIRDTSARPGQAQAIDLGEQS